MVVGMGAKGTSSAAVGLKPPPRGWRLMAKVRATPAGHAEAVRRAAIGVGDGAGFPRCCPSMVAEVESRLAQVGRVAPQAILLLHIFALCSIAPRRLVGRGRHFTMWPLSSLHVG